MLYKQQLLHTAICIIVIGNLFSSARSFCVRFVLFQPTAHQHMQLQYVADALIFLELCRVTRFIAGAIKTEDQSFSTFRIWAH